MSIEAYAYVRRLTLGKNPGRKLVLGNLADTVDNDTKSWAIKPVVLAADSEMETRQAQNHLKDLSAAGYLSVLERFNDQGKQTVSRLRLHGPWDLWGGTGQPFPETDRPKKDRRLDTYVTREVTDEDHTELRRRFQELADREGFFRDGQPRARWRLGSRAHSIVCWYGIGNVVDHDGQVATVVAITDRYGKKKAPLRVQLDYGDGPTETWVHVEDLTNPAGNPKENPSSDGVQPSAPTPKSGVQPSAPLPHQYSPEAPHPQKAQEEEEESPSAGKNPRGVRPVDLLQALTDATDEEATDLWALLEPQVKTSPGGLIRHMATNGDLDYRLDQIRRQRASQARAGAPAASRRTVCSLHGMQGTCPACRDELNNGGPLAQAVIDMYIALGSEAATLRPDLAAHPAITTLVATG